MDKDMPLETTDKEIFTIGTEKVDGPDEDAPIRVYDQMLGETRELSDEEWELESHWAGLLEVHGKKMAGHSWVIVVPKYKLDDALSELVEANRERDRLRQELEATAGCDECGSTRTTLVHEYKCPKVQRGMRAQGEVE